MRRALAIKAWPGLSYQDLQTIPADFLRETLDALEAIAAYVPRAHPD